MPTSGPLVGNMNLHPSDLRRRIAALGGRVYCYVLTTVKYVDGHLIQTGSAPNFQGGLITLCTCKHLMRAGRDLDAWEGLWVAGITGAEAGHLGRGHLFYLMRVERAFESQLDLATWLAQHAPAAADEKAADTRRLGDVYRPKHPHGNPFDPRDYVPPCPAHVHSGTAWHQDVDYVGYGRRPALLVGDPHYSFLWDEPRVPVQVRLGRGSTILDLDALLQSHDKGSER